MKRNVVLVGAVVGLGAMLYFWKRQSSGLRTPFGIPAPTSKSPGTPAGMPRVDNQSQPWYNNSLAWAQNQGQKYVQNPGLAQNDMQSVVHSISDVWGTVSGWFGNDNPGTAQSVDDVPQIDSMDLSAGSVWDNLPAGNVDQSDAVGSQTYDWGNQTMEVALMDTGVDNSNGYIDSSDSDYYGGDNEMVS